jgi:hypothetical protein
LQALQGLTAQSNRKGGLENGREIVLDKVIEGSLLEVAEEREGKFSNRLAKAASRRHGGWQGHGVPLPSKPGERRAQQDGCGLGAILG